MSPRAIHAPKAGRPWTAADDRALVWAWERDRSETIAKRLGRTLKAINQRVTRLGLGVGRPRGCESVAIAARRAGVTPRQLGLMLAFAGIRVRANQTNPYARVPLTPRRERWLFPEDVDRAVSLWAASEGVTAAARRLNVSRAALTLRLPGDAVRPYGRHLRAPSVVIERVVAEYLAAGGQQKGPAPKVPRRGGRVVA